jgi:hypothetical protein
MDEGVQCVSTWHEYRRSSVISVSQTGIKRDRCVANVSTRQSSTSPIIDESGETALAQTSEYMKIAIL